MIEEVIAQTEIQPRFSGIVSLGTEQLRACRCEPFDPSTPRSLGREVAQGLALSNTEGPRGSGLKSMTMGGSEGLHGTLHAQVIASIKKNVKGKMYAVPGLECPGS